MKRRIFAALVMGLVLAGASGSAEDKKPETNTKEEKKTVNAKDEVAVIKTLHGDLVVEFWSDVAPATVANFKKLANDKFYDGTASHRLIKGFMIQMGDPLTKDATQEQRWGTGDPGYKIKAEFNERKHVRGVLSMARSANPDSAGCQFFICFAPAPFLDRQYTTFGKVIQGEDVLAKLEAEPVKTAGSGEKSRPVNRVSVESIRIVDRSTVIK